MLPRLEMSRDECRKCLRCLELDAYANMVSVLRAQGPYTVDKKKLLQELASVLHISNERHRAEIRRAVNDDKLSAIAEQLNGPNTCTDWAIEGRRTIPLLPRLKAHNAFTTLANSLSIVTAIANEKEPRIVKKPVEVKEIPSKAVRPPYANVGVTESRKRKRTVADGLNNDYCKPKQRFDPAMLSMPTPNKFRRMLAPGTVPRQTKSMTSMPVSRPHTAPAQNLVPQTLVCNNTKVQIRRSNASSAVPMNLTKKEHKNARTKPARHAPNNNGMGSEVKDSNVSTDKAIKYVPISNSVQQISKSDLNSNTQCMKTVPVTTDVAPAEKCVQQSNALQTATTNPSYYTSCGPGPPEPPNMIRNKYMKINKFPASKVAGAKIATKGNVIVLQKPLREITLSHGGKEVRGKLIMEGKNVRLANQQNANPYCTTAVVPNKPPQVSNCNGEQSATNPVATVVHAKANKVLNAYGDSSENSKASSPIDQGPTNFDMRFEAALVDQTEEQEEVFSSQEKSNDSTNTLSSVELTSQNELSLSEKHQDEDERELNENNILCDDDETETSATIVEGYLDPQTGIYNIETTTELANEAETEDLSTSQLFEVSESEKFDIENYTLVETDETSAILDATESTMLIIDEIDEVCDS